MTDWSAGYVTDVGYTYGYYRELNPLAAPLALAMCGHAAPAFGTACELGFGQGVSINMHAAATTTEWWGTDFNPSQAAHALDLARASGTRVHLFDDAFADFCRRDDVPAMDYIGLHGIWSWISDENRSVIIDFVRRKLKVGGVLYVSYNVQPGWAPMLAMRELMASHAELAGTQGAGTVAQVEASLAFAQKLLDVNPGYVRANPSVPDKLKKLTEHNRNYLAHEYFNRDWMPMPFTQMARLLEGAKLSFAGSAFYTENVESLNITAQQQAFLKEIGNPVLRQATYDLMTNQQFRRDYWVKGPLRMSTIEQIETLKRQRVVLVTRPEDVKMTINAAQGEIKLTESIYNPLLSAMSEHEPATLAQLQARLEGTLTFAQLAQAVTVLAGIGAVNPAQSDEAARAARPATERLNDRIMESSRHHGDRQFLASPLTGGGLVVQRFEQLFLLAKRRGHATPREWADFAWAQFSARGERVLQDGKPLQTPAENLERLNKDAAQFAGARLGLLEKLQVA